MSQIIQQLKSLNVLVLGDFCIDIFKYGNCDRLSPEAPVAVFDFVEQKTMNGMAGNVYNNLINLGISAQIVKDNNDCTKTRFIDLKTKQHLLRVDENNRTSVLNIDNIDNFNYDAVIISDYNKGFITNDIVTTIINKFICPIFVDSKKTDLSKYENCIIKINESEFAKVTKFPMNYKLIVTLGENGALYNNKIIPTKKINVFDVSGAGDTFMASLVVKYLLDNDFEKAIKFANLCSSIVVTKSGTDSIMLDEVLDDICI